MSTGNAVDRHCGDDDTVRATFDGLPVIACALAGPQLRLVACNAAHRAFYPNALLGVAADDFGPELREQGILDMYDRVYQTGEPLHVAEVRVQVDLDGTGVLSIAQAAVPDTVVSHGEDGTTATATQLLTRQSVFTDLAAPAPRATAPTTFEVGTSDDGYIVVVGDVDTLAAPELKEVLSLRSQAGTRSIQVDLSAVTHLGSAAVSVLADAHELAGRHQTACTLVALPGGGPHTTSSTWWDCRPRKSRPTRNYSDSSENSSGAMGLVR